MPNRLRGKRLATRLGCLLIGQLLWPAAAGATPPDFTCEVADSNVNFELVLHTTYAGVSPGKISGGHLTILRSFNGKALPVIPFTSANLRQQWLEDGHAKNYLVFENVGSQEGLSVILKIDTTFSARESKKQSWPIYNGKYVVDLKLEASDTPKPLTSQFSGTAHCAPGK